MKKEFTQEDIESVIKAIKLPLHILGDMKIAIEANLKIINNYEQRLVVAFQEMTDFLRMFKDE